MEPKYLEKYFINPAIEYGIRSYINNKEGKEYKRAYTFEMYVINTIKAKYKKVKNILSAADMLGVK